MKKASKIKGAIYIRIFGAFLATYLVLMVGFSIFLISQEKKVEALRLEAFALQVNNIIENVLEDHIDSNNQIKNISKVKKEFVKESSLFKALGTELALFRDDYLPVFNTNDNWLCSYTEYREGTRRYMGYAFLNPRDWFSEEDVKEIENYLYATPKAKKVGDLSEYLIVLEGFWLDNEMVIPDKIRITSMFATSFDEDGNVIGSSSGKHSNDIVYVSGYENTKGLPYFEHGSIQPVNKDYPPSEKQIVLRNLVLDKEKLRETIKQGQIGNALLERVNLFTYRYYLVQPYQNTVRVLGDNNYYSQFWTVIARQGNLLEQCGSRLAFMWLSCFFAFAIAAFILARQSYKNYQEREEVERYRKEMTNALAHDLKTPLSIVSGYAQNLIENVQTEKREHYAANIQANVERMDRIVQEMLDLSRLEANSFQIKFGEVSLSEVCGKIISRYKEIWQEKSIKTHLEGDAIIKADPVLMEKVIDNFFVNALDNTPKGGRISIRIAEKTLEFYNSGSYIP